MKIIQEKASELKSQMETEITQYLTETVPISEDHEFSEYKLKRRISLFENKIYPTGKFDKQGNYKYWFDIITPAIDAEVKNIDFDSKDPKIFSNRDSDALMCIVSNLSLDEYLRTTGQAEEINNAVEEGAGWGNVLWKKIKNSYERCDLKNTYVINQTALTVDDTPIITRHSMSASELSEKSKVYDKDAVAEALKNENKTYKSQIGTQEVETTTPFHEVFIRDGMVELCDLKEARGERENEDDEGKYVLARVVGLGTKGNTTGVSITKILFAEEIKNKKMSDIYKEYHRGRYKGRWYREGLYELLMDIQVRANQIGNQIAQGLEFASKTLFTTPDKLIMQNIITDLKNGDIIRASSFQHVPVRMEGFEQLVNSWNMMISLRNEISNSREIVTGENSPNQPFRLGALLNQNANKLYFFIRQKLAIPFSEMFEQWIVPGLIDDLKTQDILRLTGDSNMLKRFCGMIVDNWYIENLASFPPHSNEEAMTIKMQEVEKLMARPQLFMEGLKASFKNFKPQVIVDITGEQTSVDSDLQTIGTFVGLEMDPVRRTALIEMAMMKKGIDVGRLPKAPPQPLPQPDKTQPSQEQLNKKPQMTPFKGQPVAA